MPEGTTFVVFHSQIVYIGSTSRLNDMNSEKMQEAVLCQILYFC